MHPIFLPSMSVHSSSQATATSCEQWPSERRQLRRICAGTSWLTRMRFPWDFPSPRYFDTHRVTLRFSCSRRIRLSAEEHYRSDERVYRKSHAPLPRFLARNGAKSAQSSACCFLTSIVASGLAAETEELRSFAPNVSASAVCESLATQGSLSSVVTIGENLRRLTALHKHSPGPSWKGASGRVCTVSASNILLPDAMLSAPFKRPCDAER